MCNDNMHPQRLARTGKAGSVTLMGPDFCTRSEALAASTTSMHTTESIMQKSVEFCARGSLWVPWVKTPPKREMLAGGGPAHNGAAESLRERQGKGEGE